MKLLNEDPAVWDKILKWQTQYIKRQQLIQALSSANFMDDLYPLAPKTHERLLMRELKGHPLLGQIAWLKRAADETPDFSGVKNEELRLLLEITGLRVQHALLLREAIRDGRPPDAAKKVREAALVKMNMVREKYNRYPESFIFEEKENPTSYPYGYGWPAATLHFWEREEMIIRNRQGWNPFYMNIYNPLRILL